MATYILVHGADQSEHIWDTIALLLRQEGHEVFCPTMTSIKKTTLQHNIEEVRQFIHEHTLTEFILVGHSYASLVVTGLLDEFNDKIQCLVYIDSIVPKSGKSLHDVFVDLGFDYVKDFNLTLDQPVITPLYFDEQKLMAKPKAYIHCLKSGFKAISQPFYEAMVHADHKHWLYFDLNAPHNCMESHPGELAVILLGLSHAKAKN